MPEIPQEHFNLLVEILVNKADEVDPINSRTYYWSLMNQAALSDEFRRNAKNFNGNSEVDAQMLLRRALTQNRNSKNTNYTTLGSLLQPLLKPNVIDIDHQRYVAAIIYRDKLYLDPQELENLATRFSIPREAQPAVNEGSRQGPDFDPHLPEEELVLQSFLRREPPSLLDIGTLQLAMKCASAVCRIVFSGEGRGTGFRLRDNLILTNYHVINKQGRESKEAMLRNAQSAKFQFGYLSAPGGQAVAGQTFNALQQDTIVKASPVEEMDYALLRIDEAVLDIKGIGEVEFALETPATNTSLNVIQHPKGEVMKLALSGDGVTWVSNDQRLVQYVTPAAEGSSGSPCFNSEWKLVALHHAEQIRRFGPFGVGSIREGILFSKIYEDLQKDPQVSL